MCVCTDEEDFSQINDFPVILSAGSPIDSTACFNITINNDEYVEYDEDFTISIRSTDDDPVNNDTKGITIIDNDCECSARIVDRGHIKLTHAAITIAFAMETATEVSEGSFFPLCVAIVNGSLGRSTNVMLETLDNTATGMNVHAIGIHRALALYIWLLL